MMDKLKKLSMLTLLIYFGSAMLWANAWVPIFMYSSALWPISILMSTVGMIGMLYALFYRATKEIDNG